MFKRFATPYINAPAVNLRGRSPFNQNIGIPPGYTNPLRVKIIGGIPTVQGIQLSPGTQNVEEMLVASPISQEKSGAAIPSFEPGGYGDSDSFRVDIVANIPQKVLDRPAMTRTLLLIQNKNAVGVISYNFGNSPSLTASIDIPAGGNRVWDGGTVPQGTLWLNAGANSVVVIEYMNKNLSEVGT